jgi:hypothetical protein
VDDSGNKGKPDEEAHMNVRKCLDAEQSSATKCGNTMVPQRILVFQQDRSGEGKIKGIRKYGEKGLYIVEIISIEEAGLPPVMDDTTAFLPSDFRADLAMDFLKHPDLSLDLALLCRNKGIPLVASGKKLRVKGALTPPT